MPVTLLCSECAQEFQVKPYRRETAKYCSRRCSDKHTLRKSGENHYYKDKPGPATGKTWKLSDTTKYRMSKAKRGIEYPQLQGENHHNWKGHNVSYRNLHRWIERTAGKPDTCEHCGLSGLIEHQIHWANVSGEYKRDTSDYLRLCVKCHKAYDFPK